MSSAGAAETKTSASANNGGSSSRTSISSRIRPLSKDVVDRIAAGEVVQRPASVVKELIENSMDALPSSVIDVMCCAHGGMTLLEVTDDGCGIPPMDLGLAATRFATSKLRALDDLQQIQTFGFRGEALASTSMVSRLSITSKQRRQPNGNNKETQQQSTSTTDSSFHHGCAYTQSYKDGKPVQQKPLPSAGNVGTKVRVEDLFYNVPSRKRAFTSSTKKELEEYHRVLAVTQRYAIHKSLDGLSFTCQRRKRPKSQKNQSSSALTCDLNTKAIPAIKRVRDALQLKLEDNKQRQGVSAAAAEEDDPSLDSTRDTAVRTTIGHVFGSAVAKDLVTIKASVGDLYSSRSVVTSDTSSAATTTTSKSESYNNELEALTNDDNYAYKAQGWLTKSALGSAAKSGGSSSSSSFVLFINHRLVESTAIRQAVEGVYADVLSHGGSKPFVYLSLLVPGNHIDVNVHPTKKEVALLFEDRLCRDLAMTVRTALTCANASKEFPSQPLVPQVKSQSERKRKAASSSSSEPSTSQSTPLGPLSRRLPLTQQQPRWATRVLSPENNGNCNNTDDEDAQAPHPQVSASSFTNFEAVKQEQTETETTINTNTQGLLTQTPRHTPHPPFSLSQPGSQQQKQQLLQSSTKKKAIDPTRLVRTNSAAKSGALEPYLFQRSSTDTTADDANVDAQNENGRTKSKTSSSLSPFQSFAQHDSDCEMALALSNTNKSSIAVDMSTPGAFAAAICRCQVNKGGVMVTRRRPKDSSLSLFARPQKIVPSPCSYSSIHNLRRQVLANKDADLMATLRDSSYVGCISRHRSLIQSGIELLEINHTHLATELFYQVALNRFANMSTAQLGSSSSGSPVDVQALVEQSLNIEQSLKACSDAGQSLSAIAFENVVVSSSADHEEIAILTAKCLRVNGRASMLEEYFGIVFKEDGRGNLLLAALPVLIEGHSPSPYGLSTFLLKLATEVDWDDEADCFQGICMCLAQFYASIPYDEDTPEQPTTISKDDNDANVNEPHTHLRLADGVMENFVKHTLFPSICYSLIPPKTFATDGSVTKLAMLSSLYKVFERC
jgi:DNA mismatch repair protein MutL